MTDLYQELILEEARSPQNHGKLTDADQVLTGRNASCGDEVTIYLKWGVDQQGNKIITDLKWEGQGCVISQAAMSVLSGMIMGKSVKEVLAITPQNLEAQLGIETLSPGRVKCLMLGLFSIQKKLHDK
jgi:nitrogen fixation NifU-like protein